MLERRDGMRPCFSLFPGHARLTLNKLMMSDPDANSLQARVNKRISDFIPRDAWQSTVAIVVAKRPAVHLLGTGSLFQIADRHFVVTAAHVIRLAHEYDRTIGI